MTSVNIHASCVVLADSGRSFGAPADSGVLLLGESGAGKSDLALRLIERGAVLVADDRAELFVREESLWARAPRSLAGLIELRGIGIIALPHREEARIGLAVMLSPPKSVPRLPGEERYAPPATLALTESAWPPLLRLAAFEDSAPAKIMAASAAYANALFRDNHKPK